MSDLETVDEAVAEFFRFVFDPHAGDETNGRLRSAYLKMAFDERVRRVGAAYLRGLSDRGPLDAALAGAEA